MSTDKQKNAEKKLHETGVNTADDLDLTTEEGLAAYPHKLANVTRGDLLLAMQGGSGTSGIEKLQERWNKADHGTQYENEDHLALHDRASQGKATQVQGARAPEKDGTPRPNTAGNTVSIPPKPPGQTHAKGHDEARS